MPSKFDFFGSLKSMILKIFCCDGLTAQVLVAIVLLLAFSQNVCTFCQAHSATPSWGLIVTPGATLHGKNPALVECPKVFQTMIKKNLFGPKWSRIFSINRINHECAQYISTYGPLSLNEPMAHEPNFIPKYTRCRPMTLWSCSLAKASWVRAWRGPAFPRQA